MGDLGQILCCMDQELCDTLDSDAERGAEGKKGKPISGMAVPVRVIHSFFWDRRVEVSLICLQMAGWSPWKELYIRGSALVYVAGRLNIQKHQ